MTSVLWCSRPAGYWDSASSVEAPFRSRATGSGTCQIMVNIIEIDIPVTVAVHSLD